MNTKQLMHCIKEDSLLNKYCLGVFPFDVLPRPQSIPTCAILNLDRKNQPGSHWVAVFIDESGVGEYFDTYGRPPKKSQIKNYFKKHALDWKFNEKMIQSPYSSVCGQFCIYYLCHRIRGISMEEICDRFSNNGETNDFLVMRWVNKRFDLNTTVLDFDFIINQICHALNE